MFDLSANPKERDLVDSKQLFTTISAMCREIFCTQYVYYKPSYRPGLLGSRYYKTSDKPKQGYIKHVYINEGAVKKWLGEDK